MMMKTEIRVKLLLAEQSQRWPAKLSIYWVRGQGQSLPKETNSVETHLDF